MLNDDELARLLRAARTVAVIGISDRPDRPSHAVASYLQAQGYRVMPVNPRLEQVLGETCYPSLSDVPAAVDIVDVFRRAEETPAIAAEAVASGARALWLQEGIANDEAARLATGAGLAVVMDHCILKEHARLKAAGAL